MKPLGLLCWLESINRLEKKRQISEKSSVMDITAAVAG